MVFVDFLLGVTCVYVLVGGDQADHTGNYRYNGTCTHTSTHTVITKVFWRKEYMRLTWWKRETKSDIDQLKAELAKAQSEKLSMSSVPAGEYSKESSTSQLTEKRVKKKGRRKKREKKKIVKR